MSVNAIHNELHLDNNPYDQIEGTYRDNRNGLIIHSGGDNYVWKNTSGTELYFDLGTDNLILSWCWIRERLFIITLNESANTITIFEISIDEEGEASTTTRYTGSNELLNFSFDNPILKMIGFYENENIQRIYLTDYHNQPRIINVGNSDIESIAGKEKFLNFYPIIDNPYGKLSFVDIFQGGNLYAGTYIICWQYYTKDGYYSDWSPLSNPISVTGSIPAGMRWDDYQNYQGKNYTENTFKGIKITLEDLDTDYDGIRIAAFYSNDYNSIASGSVFHEGAISSSMTIIYTGSESVGTLTISEVTNVSVLIEKVKDISIIKNLMVLSNLQERSELDVSTSNADEKNDRIDCEVNLCKYDIILDYSNRPTESWTDNYKSLQQSVLSGALGGLFVTTEYLLPGIWYKNESPSDLVYETSDTVVHTILPGQFFRPSEYVYGYNAITGPIYTPVSASLHIVLLKYRKSSAVVPVDEIANQGVHINDGWVFDSHRLTSEWLDYKSSKISHYLKGYPQGEKVRLGITFFDATGRPFFTRWLKNTDVTYASDGDTVIPLRNQSTNRLVTKHAIVDDDYILTLGHINGLRIKNIDITDIRDRIKGMMIVRAPIIRKYPASGVIVPIFYNSNNKEATITKWFSGGTTIFDANTAYDPQAYGFYCPEDIFQLSGFSIQPGDHIVNNMYLKARDASETYKTGWTGFGYIEKNEGNYTGFIHKLYDDATALYSQNGALNVRHEVLFSTKYTTDTEDLSIYDPVNITKKYRSNSVQHIATDTYRSHLNDHSILILDINHGAGTNIKGIHNLAINNPHALVCLVEKAIDNTYGGSGESSLASTKYISTGHYQEINDQVLSDIEDNGSYIFNDIDVFGGDTFLGMFDYCKFLGDEDAWSHVYNSSFIIPLESRINFAMRGDNHIARNRSYSENNILGLRRKLTGMKLEDYNYNDAYSTDNIDAYYLALPFNFINRNIFDVRHRYSNYKFHGELRDSFRKYDALSYLDVYSQFGPIINTATVRDYLVYWQPDMIGYIPVSERATQSGQLGELIQIGIGGIFERHDEIVKQVGNSNHFGLVESAHGFHWYDSKRKLFIHLPFNMQLSYESITKGADSFFNSIPLLATEYDNPLKDYGIFGGYDPENKVVFYSFIMPDDFRETIAVNIKTGKISGFWDFNSRMYISYKNIFCGIGDDQVSVYRHNVDNDGLLYDQQKDAYITIVVKEKDLQEKIFDSFVVIGNDEFFDEIKYENSSQQITEVISESRDYKYRNNRWYGNFPKVSRQRFVDGYMIVTMKVTDTSKTVMFNKMISQLTNMY